MVLTDDTGFFPNYYLNLKNSLTDAEKKIEKILDHQTDYDRFVYVDKLVSMRDDDLKVNRTFDGKNETLAIELKEKGNLAFKAMKWFDAMLLYTKSYLALPESKTAEKSVILANRSAALYHLEKFDDALLDIKRSLEYGYPKELLYKLYERQARCYLAKKSFRCSIEAFKKTISAIDECKLPQEKRSKIQLDAMSMMKVLESDPRVAKQSGKETSSNTESIAYPGIRDEKELISATIRIDANREEGRFARAAGDIKAGEEILIEKPFAVVLLQKFTQTHCEGCFVRVVVPVACPKCTDVVYCSEKCQQKAAAKYHKFECGILPTIWRSGASINCHLAMRVIASRPLEYFLKMRDHIAKELSVEEILRLPKNDYRRVSHLVSHADKRSASNFFHHTLMARFLLKCLMETDYFGKTVNPDDALLIGSLILRNLQFIQFNTHEIFELHTSQAAKSEKTVFIGGGLYPTLALFNHSCDPGVVRYFRGNTIHVNTVRPIEAGLQISENYGPIYTQEGRCERQAKLKELYWFDCFCDACLENWPKFEDLKVDVIRFRCDSTDKCPAIIEVPANCNDFMVKCVQCGQSTNIFKGLKVMQDTELMTRTAKRLYDAGEYSKAINKFIDLLKIMFEVLAPPFPDFCQCQQSVRDCFLHFGNVYNLE